VAQVRKKWRRVPILVRGDSGFCRDAIMDWCERQGIDYVLGLAKNPRLLKEIAEELKTSNVLMPSAAESWNLLSRLWTRGNSHTSKAAFLVISSLTPDAYEDRSR
jgi:hypothetical protein